MTNPHHRRKAYVGIDVSKRTLDVCILPEGAPEDESFVVAIDQEGVDELPSRFVAAEPEANPPALVAL